MNKKLYLYSRRKKDNSYIKVGQFTPRDMPDRPDWPNKPLLTVEERERLVAELIK